ncbi:MAG: RNA polymerase sigma factor [FCB group bacterium]|nr:RNA polymerase sigma factor [FCB group bacterium]MBL7028342.1 RNA polymerase sigma factor [Candidatus Neomarinimicrobiota bacterium]MBL7121661.1 RNA polymerase sigma factor [Candidatus Neomarinimicrobiota bacterium]
MSYQEAKTTDAELILNCQSDDQRAFRILVERYQATAFRFAFRLTCDTPEAEDLCQKAFIRVWNYRNRINQDSLFSTLLYTIVSRLWLDHLKSKRLRFFVGKVEVLDTEIVDPNVLPEILAINQDLAQRIKTLSKKLPPRQRLVFTLRDLEDLNIREVMEVTGLSRGSVKTNLSIARQKIRKQLQNLTGQIK